MHALQCAVENKIFHVFFRYCLHFKCDDDINLKNLSYLTSVPQDLLNFSSIVFGRAHRSRATLVTSSLIHSDKSIHPRGG